MTPSENGVLTSRFMCRHTVQEEDEIDRFKTGLSTSITQLNGFADQTMRAFLEKYNQRRVLFNDAFQTAADHSADGCIGEAEFRRAVQMKLKLGLTEKALKVWLSSL